MVNSVSFGTRMGVFDKANLDAPQTFTRPVAPTAPEKPAKKHKGLRKVVGFVATVAAAAGALALGSKFGIFKTDKVAKAVGKLKDASWLQWAKKPAKTVLNGLDKAGNFVLEKSSSIGKVVSEYAKKGVDFVKGIFAKKAA